MSKSNAFERVFGIDEDLANNGVEIIYGPMVITITHAGDSNRAFVAAMERETRPHRRDIQNETMDNDTAQEMMHRVYAATIVKGWRKVEGEKYKDVEVPPYSKDECLRQFKAPKSGSNFFREVSQQAQRIANFRRDEVEEDAGN